ncbi:hypothetical protein MIR68_010879 [Amoeboaphelidium protococcarum]|nr:hypothetical protein MIR68_010879 [Amoeboaphelidium protococcarum]
MILRRVMRLLRNKRHPCNLILLIVFAVSVYALSFVYHLYAAFNLQLFIKDDKFLQSIHSIQELQFSYPADYEVDLDLQTAKSYCKSACTYWNPTITHWNGLWLIAVRESSRSQCGGVIGTVSSLMKMLRPAESSIVIGFINASQMKERQLQQQQKTLYYEIQIMYRLPDFEIPDLGAYHTGQEDPRWIVAHPHIKDVSTGTKNQNARDGSAISQKRLFLLSSSERWGKPRLFLRQIQVGNLTARSDYASQKTGDDDISSSDYFKGVELRFLGTSQLSPRWKDAPYKQKNWMYVPIDMSTASNREYFRIAEGLDGLVFLYLVHPLKLVFVDTFSGNSFALEYEDDHIHMRQLPPIIQLRSGSLDLSTLRGSSAFIDLRDVPKFASFRESPTEQSYLAIVHSVAQHQSSLDALHVGVYQNYFIRLCFDRYRLKDGRGQFWISHISDSFTMPQSEQYPTVSPRINYPTSLVYDIEEDVFIIPYGVMDCQSLVLKLKSDFVLQSLQHIDYSS